MNVNANTFGQALFGDLLPVNVLSVTEDKYMQSIQTFVQRENEFLNQIMSILCDKGTDVQTGFLDGVGGRLQKISKRGGSEVTRHGQRWWTGYPIAAWGEEQAYEIPWLKRATFVELAANILGAVLSDINTVIVEMLRALLRNDSYNHDDTQWPGRNAVNLTGVNGGGALIAVKPLANADGSVGSVYNFGKEILLANLNHYLVSGGANPTIGAFNTIKTALRNVGNDTDIVYVTSRTTADYIQANFGSDFILPVEALNRFSAQDLFGKYATQGYGMFETTIRTRGRLSNFGELVEWPHFPDGYCFAYDRTKEPPLRMRESDLADEQGFGMAPQDPHIPDVQGNPLAGKRWRRIMGFGARNRCNGVVMQFTTNGSYTTPTL